MQHEIHLVGRMHSFGGSILKGLVLASCDGHAYNHLYGWTQSCKTRIIVYYLLKKHLGGVIGSVLTGLASKADLKVQKVGQQGDPGRRVCLGSFKKPPGLPGPLLKTNGRREAMLMGARRNEFLGAGPLFDPAPGVVY